MLTRQAVSSSQIKSVGHDPKTNRLHVEFHGRGEVPGKVAEYDGVSAEQAKALVNAPSVGKHFHVTIRGNEKKHPWRYV
jgi:hypothetical protein